MLNWRLRARYVKRPRRCSKAIAWSRSSSKVIASPPPLSERARLLRVLRRVLLAQLLLPPQIVHGIGPVAVSAHGEHIGGRTHDPAQALLQRQSCLAPCRHAITEGCHVLIPEIFQRGTGQDGVPAIGTGHNEWCGLVRDHFVNT